MILSSTASYILILWLAIGINNSTSTSKMPASTTQFRNLPKQQAPGTWGRSKLRMRARQATSFKFAITCFILLHLATIVSSQPISTPDLSPTNLIHDEPITSINQTLAYLNDEAVYVGEFQSLQPSPILDWITVQSGEIHLNFERFYGLSWEKIREKEKGKTNFNFFMGQAMKPEPAESSQAVEAMEQKYRVQLLLLNPQYITQQLLKVEFDISPSRLAVNGSSSEANNGSLERCIMLSENEWACNNTRLNYSKYWRRTELDPDSFYQFNISYRMKIETKDTADYKQFKVSFQIQESEAVADNLTGSPLIHFMTKQALVLRNRVASFTVYCSFISLVILIQIMSAQHIARSLANNHMMAPKFSLITISYCTVFDLSAAIDYAYRALDSSDIYYKIFLFFPTIASVVLYFGFDIQLLTRILLAKFNNWNAEGQRVNLKKFLILFYIGFFISYEGFVLLKAFFEYQWWLILFTSCLVFVPQIVRNARCGHGGDNGFNYWYILGFLATRALLTLYEHACPANYLKIKPFPWLAGLLSALTVVSIVVLFLQSKFGAIFFIPKRLRPGHYNYSRKLKIDENGEQSLECVVCLHDLRQNPEQQSPDPAQNFNQSGHQEIKANMLTEVLIYRTPCGHIFHENCLKSWMQVKLECPTCRTKLPML